MVADTQFLVGQQTTGGAISTALGNIAGFAGTGARWGNLVVRISRMSSIIDLDLRYVSLKMKKNSF